MLTIPLYHSSAHSSPKNRLYPHLLFNLFFFGVFSVSKSVALRNGPQKGFNLILWSLYDYCHGLYHVFTGRSSLVHLLIGWPVSLCVLKWLNEKMTLVKLAIVFTKMYTYTHITFYIYRPQIFLQIIMPKLDFLGRT